jgi:hypothetical protein
VGVLISEEQNWTEKGQTTSSPQIQSPTFSRQTKKEMSFKCMFAPRFRTTKINDLSFMSSSRSVFGTDESEKFMTSLGLTVNGPTPKSVASALRKFVRENGGRDEGV